MTQLDPIPPKVKECLSGLTPSRQVILRSYIASLRVDWKQKEQELQELKEARNEDANGEASCASKCRKGCCGSAGDDEMEMETEMETETNTETETEMETETARGTDPRACSESGCGVGKNSACGGQPIREGGGGGTCQSDSPTKTAASPPSSKSGCSKGCCG